MKKLLLFFYVELNSNNNIKMYLPYVQMNVIPSNFKYVSGGCTDINHHEEKHDIIEIWLLSWWDIGCMKTQPTQHWIVYISIVDI